MTRRPSPPPVPEPADRTTLTGDGDDLSDLR